VGYTAHMILNFNSTLMEFEFCGIILPLCYLIWNGRCQTSKYVGSVLLVHMQFLKIFMCWLLSQYFVLYLHIELKKKTLLKGIKQEIARRKIFHLANFK